jgi:hypothetical protein
MNLEEIKTAIDEGETVHWSNSGYTVIRDYHGQYLIAWNYGRQDANYVGLTWRDGVIMNGKPEEFYVA